MNIYLAGCNGMYGRQIFIEVSTDYVGPRFGKPDQILNVLQFAPNINGDYEFVETHKEWQSRLDKLGKIGNTNKDITKSDVMTTDDLLFKF